LTISVIIPSWNDAENLASLLPTLAGLDRIDEIIVVDASGDSESERIAREAGVKFLHCGETSRGGQMNHGAAAATGDVFVFQHADTVFEQGHLEAIESAMKNPSIAGGAFYRKFDERHPHLKWLEHFARFLTRRGGTLFGDQTVFVRREIFSNLGGYAKIPLMEDVEFSARLRATGEIAILDPPVRSSSRHHDEKGAWRTSLQNGLFILLYKMGVSPQRLHRWYYRDRRRTILRPRRR
jgi:rSAM/selenodomain-associated transferase 2